MSGGGGNGRRGEEEEQDWIERDEVNERVEVSGVCVVSDEYTKVIEEMLLR